jgi:copper resistance protein C
MERDPQQTFHRLRGSEDPQQTKETSMFNLSRIAGFTAALSLAFAGEALAHAHLKSATPATDGTVKVSPTELDLKFSEGLNIKFTGVKLIGADKKEIPTGDAKLGTSDDTMLIVPIAGTLAPGAYSVEWHALSTDGHKTTGSYGFTIKP